ncbi:MAG: phenylalanine--tRNA ligase subunit beta [Bacteroidetes bacterium]|nr:phenylalanine--tRNA ligase subunit beta [Bacteroidota bacterium]
MRISYKWLSTLVNINTTPIELSQKLTSAGLEVESIEDESKKYENFVVGKVLSVEKHPNADKLSVCQVQLSQQESNVKQIVCGAPNVAANQKVVVALPGATVPHNQHDPKGKPFVISEATLRGKKSYGMICSGKELGVNEESSGILILPENIEIGMPYSAYLGMVDVSLEIGITPNRPDCLSHIGIAREAAAAYGVSLKRPIVHLDDIQNSTIEKKISVTIENETACPRYVARLIKNVQVKESPEWMQKFLKAAGVRPINNIVDVTNYVMLENGQPLHAFDYEFLRNNKIVVKDSTAGETFKTLDGKEHKLNGTELMICDGIRAVALAGVMGGENSEISLNTKDVLLEAAYFHPSTVRRTAKRLGISTESSYRFERGVDPNITNEASKRAALLIAELSGGIVADEYIDCYPKKIEPKKIQITSHRVNKILGTDLTNDIICKLLQSISIQVEKKENFIECTVPTFRPDIEQEMDLIEEVARLYGYDNIEDKFSSEISFGKVDKNFTTINQIRSWFESNGFNEIVTNSLMDERIAKDYGNTLVHVKNPLTQELSILRPSLLPTMLQAVAHNNNHGIYDLRLVEIGKTFSLTNEKTENVLVNGFKEKLVIGILLSGNDGADSWYKKSEKFDIFSIKGYIESLLTYLGLDNIHLIWYDKSSSLSKETINIEINGIYAGYLTKCHKGILLRDKIEQDVYFCELELNFLLYRNKEKTYKEYSKFPIVIRDLAFVVDRNVRVGEIETVIQKEKKYLTQVRLFDLFEHSSLGENKKSAAFSLSFVSPEKTLTDTEIELEISEIIKRVTTAFHATLRAI